MPELPCSLASIYSKSWVMKETLTVQCQFVGCFQEPSLLDGQHQVLVCSCKTVSCKSLSVCVLCIVYVLRIWTGQNMLQNMHCSGTLLFYNDFLVKWWAYWGLKDSNVFSWWPYHHTITVVCWMRPLFCFKYLDIHLHHLTCGSSYWLSWWSNSHYHVCTVFS